MLPSIGAHALQALTPQTAVTVDRSRCVRHRYKHNACSKCVDVCHAKAIAWDDEHGLAVAPGRCTQCLSCLVVCPTAALRSPELSLLQVLADLAAHPEPVLGCMPNPGAKMHARFSCLGYLGNVELLLLFALTFAEGIQFDLSHCQGCPNGHVLEGVCSAYAIMQNLLPENRVILVDDEKCLKYKPASLSRRELFRFFRERSSLKAAVMVERLQAGANTQSYGNKQGPLARTLLIETLDSLPAPKQAQIAGQVFGEITFTPGCTACGRCVGVCPTGALEPVEIEQQPPAFNSQLCVNCGSCKTFCQKQGVQLTVKNQNTVAMTSV